MFILVKMLLEMDKLKSGNKGHVTQVLKEYLGVMIVAS